MSKRSKAVEASAAVSAPAVTGIGDAGMLEGFTPPTAPADPAPATFTIELKGPVDAELFANAVLPDELDQDPGEAEPAATAEERSRDYKQGLREGRLQAIEYVEADFGEVGRIAAAEARKRWSL